MPADWAMTQNNLGNALASQGERTSGSEGLRLLDEAVTAYRDALTVRTRADMPADWAMTQNNLGTALQTQGDAPAAPRAFACSMKPSRPIATRSPSAPAPTCPPTGR